MNRTVRYANRSDRRPRIQPRRDSPQNPPRTGVGKIHARLVQKQQIRLFTQRILNEPHRRDAGIHLLLRAYHRYPPPHDIKRDTHLAPHAKHPYIVRIRRRTIPGYERE